MSINNIRSHASSPSPPLHSFTHSFTPLPPRQASTYDAITRQTAFNVVAALKKRLRLPSLPFDSSAASKAVPFAFVSAAEAGWPEVELGDKIEAIVPDGKCVRASTSFTHGAFVQSVPFVLFSLSYVAVVLSVTSLCASDFLLSYVSLSVGCLFVHINSAAAVPDSETRSGVGAVIVGGQRPDRVPAHPLPPLAHLGLDQARRAAHHPGACVISARFQ